MDSSDLVWRWYWARLIGLVLGTVAFAVLALPMVFRLQLPLEWIRLTGLVQLVGWVLLFVADWRLRVTLGLPEAPYLLWIRSLWNHIRGRDY